MPCTEMCEVLVVKGNNAISFKLYNMNLKLMIQKSIIYTLTSLVAITWTMLVFNLLTKGIDANASFGLY